MIKSSIEHYKTLLQAAQPRLQGRALIGRVLVVDADGAPQTLCILHIDENGAIQLAGQPKGGEENSYLVSTSGFGLGYAANSNRTPLGWHAIHTKVGGCGDGTDEAAPVGAKFEHKAFTGRVWNPAKEGHDEGSAMMLSRLIVLGGLEPGVNHGTDRNGLCVDTLQRSIYFHGTNYTQHLGQPASHGCIRLDPREVIDVFDLVEVNDLVLIAGTPGPAPAAPSQPAH